MLKYRTFNQCFQLFCCADLLLQHWNELKQWLTPYLHPTWKYHFSTILSAKIKRQKKKKSVVNKRSPSNFVLTCCWFFWDLSTPLFFCKREVKCLWMWFFFFKFFWISAIYPVAVGTLAWKHHPWSSSHPVVPQILALCSEHFWYPFPLQGTETKWLSVAHWKKKKKQPGVGLMPTEW